MMVCVCGIMIQYLYNVEYDDMLYVCVQASCRCKWWPSPPPPSTAPAAARVEIHIHIHKKK